MRLRLCAGSPGPLLVAYVISTLLSCAGSNKEVSTKVRITEQSPYTTPDKGSINEMTTLESTPSKPEQKTERTSLKFMSHLHTTRNVSKGHGCPSLKNLNAYC